MTYEIKTTKQFKKWFAKVKNSSERIKILARLDRVENGNFGDHKQIDTDISELRFFFGSGFRIYYTIQSSQVVLLINGGNKSTQEKDIKNARKILNEIG